MQEHIKIIGILWVVFGALSLFGALFLFGILFGISFIPGMGEIAPGILRIVGIGLASLMAVLGLPNIIGGWGLLKGREWARVLVLILAFLSLFNVPFGTALGIYSLIVLFNPEAVKLFQGPPAGQ
jgi:hypothetical protein